MVKFSMPLAAAAALLSLAGHATAAPAPDVAFAERSALLALDVKCDLLRAPVRTALEAATNQAHGALLRSGWTQARAAELRTRAAEAGARKACTDPAVAKAVTDANTGYAGWARVMSMRFTGGFSAWSARRTPDPDRFLLRQDAIGSRRGAFGLRETENGVRMTLALPIGAGERAPATVRLVLRDRGKAPVSAPDLRQTPARNLSELAPSQAMQAALLPMARGQARLENPNRTHVLFMFPDGLANRLAMLDPREAFFVEIDGPSPQRLLFEVGDFAAARAFLAAQ